MLGELCHSLPTPRLREEDEVRGAQSGRLVLRRGRVARAGGDCVLGLQAHWLSEKASLSARWPICGGNQRGRQLSKGGHLI